tara:strand:+ start:556 stop:684 length:129 start_codon:yes stop_codon:yes gene_type:complete
MEQGLAHINDTNFVPKDLLEKVSGRLNFIFWFFRLFEFLKDR